MPSCPNCNSWLKPGLSNNGKTFTCDSCGASLCEDNEKYKYRKLRFIIALFFFPIFLLFLGTPKVIFWILVIPVVFISYVSVSKYKVVDRDNKWGGSPYDDV